MKRLISSTGITVIKPTAATERSKRAQHRVLEKLRDRPRSATELTVLERTELRALEAAGWVECGADFKWKIAGADLPPPRGAPIPMPTPPPPVLEPRCSWCAVKLEKAGPHHVCGTCLHRELAELGSEGAPV